MYCLSQSQRPPWLNACKQQGHSFPELACPTDDIKFTQQKRICQKSQQTLTAHLTSASDLRAWLHSRGTNKVAAWRRHFLKYFLEWKCWRFDSNVTEVYFQGVIHQNWFGLWLCVYQAINLYTDVHGLNKHNTATPSWPNVRPLCLTRNVAMHVSQWSSHKVNGSQEFGKNVNGTKPNQTLINFIPCIALGTIRNLTSAPLNNVCPWFLLCCAYIISFWRPIRNDNP